MAHTWNHSCSGTEIRRIVVQSQHRQTVHKTTSQPRARCSGTFLSSQLHREGQVGEWWSRMWQDHISKIAHAKKAGKSSSSGRAPAYQRQSPEPKPQYHQKKKSWQ
jgi:hypothetical protein